MQNEIWKPIPSVPKYFASSLGEILGPRGKLSLFPRRGYLKCQAGGKQHRVNRLVCEAFHGEPPSNEHHAGHKDGNRTNNKEENLYWATTKENAADLVRHGSLRGENHPRAKLSVADVISIRERRTTGETYASIASSFPGCSQATITHAATGRNWK